MLPYRNHHEKLNLIKSGKLSLPENVKYFLDRVEEKKEINGFNFIFKEDALKSALDIEKKIIQGNAGRLAGMVIAIKDVLALKDKPLTCSSGILKDFISLYTGTAVQKIIDEDAIIIGKTNCDQFAMGSSNENSYFGHCLNPCDLSRVPGGSSGGSAAVVAAELCDAALGTDTGGSIRQPAAFCGIYGLKPTYGRVSRYGLTAYASSFDCIGPMTGNIDDAELILSVISGFDPKDSTSMNIEPVLSGKDYELTSKYKIGVPQEYFAEGLDPEIKLRIEEYISFLKNSGFEIVNINLPYTQYSIATYYILTTAEASSNLSRFDGARYGFRSDSASSLADMYTHSRSEGFGEEVKRRIMLGTYVLSAGYYDAYYRKAQQVRRLFKNDFENAFKQVDLLITPTAPTAAYKIGEKADDPLQMYLGDIYTTSANLAGIPGISIPAGVNKQNLPIGIQFMTNHFQENKLINISRFIGENFKNNK